jgi:cytochrome P450 family 135
MATPASQITGARAPRPVQLYYAMRRESQMIEKLQREHGDVFRIKFERRPWNIVAHPDAIKQVFTSPPDVLHAGEANEILRPSLGSHSVLLLDEKPHMRQRKLLLPAFHGERLQAQREAMERAAAEQVKRMPPDRPFSLRPHSQAIALEVILDVVLGAAEGEEHDRLAAALLRMLDFLMTPQALAFSATLGPDHRLVKRIYRPIVAPLDEALYRLIRERRAVDPAELEERTDVLSMLLLARDEDGQPMSDAELRDELVTLIVAGHETTATALAWSFERLTRMPAQLARLEDESRRGETTYSEAVAKEALRLRPVLNNVVRVVKKPVEIGGYDFQPGDVVSPSIYLVHRRPEIYADPTRFDPDRWLDTKPGTYSWIPFGGGTRRCIGASFALVEMEVVLRAVARGVHLEPAGEPEKPVARFITSSPSRGGEVRVARTFGSDDPADTPPLVAVA